MSPLTSRFVPVRPIRTGARVTSPTSPDQMNLGRSSNQKQRNNREMSWSPTFTYGPKRALVDPRTVRPSFLKDLHVVSAYCMIRIKLRGKS